MGQLLTTTHSPPPSDDVSVPTCMRPPDFHYRTSFSMVVSGIIEKLGL
jgi:hypothetical protein